MKPSRHDYRGGSKSYRNAGRMGQQNYFLGTGYGDDKIPDPSDKYKTDPAAVFDFDLFAAGLAHADPESRSEIERLIERQLRSSCLHYFMEKAVLAIQEQGRQAIAQADTLHDDDLNNADQLLQDQQAHPF